MLKYVFFFLFQGVPHYWDTMPADTTCVSITLNAGTPEYSEIQKQFKQSFHQNIIKVNYSFIRLQQEGGGFFLNHKWDQFSFFPDWENPEQGLVEEL